MTLIELGLLALLLLNLGAFLLFGWDKKIAGTGRRRVPEARLLGLCLLGGWIGGWVAMSLFRHKTAKTSFKVKMALITTLWVGGGCLVWLR